MRFSLFAYTGLQRANGLKLSGGKYMSTYMPKAETMTRKWYVLDATGKPVGRLAVVAATVLRGKHKPDFATHLDCGDHVIILNAEKAIFTGNKLDQKYYRHHTGWVGHLREIKYRTLMSKNPEKAIELAVKGMIPATVIGRSALSRLRIFKGAEHDHAAQKPEVWSL
jgi:large subunit ribosomal protein L13